MTTSFEATLGFNPDAPVVVIEGRAPLPNQQVTRQTYLPVALYERGVQTLYIEGDSPTTYTSAGLIRTYTVYGGATHTLERGGLRAPAWRLRDLTWAGADLQAFGPGYGYNGQRLRQELATRLGVSQALVTLGLHNWSIETLPVSPARLRVQRKEDALFIKPNLIKDVGLNRPGRRTRACLIDRRAVTPLALDEFGDSPVMQLVEPRVNAQQLLNQLGVNARKKPRTDCLHVLRVYQPLWLGAEQAPAVELRLSYPEDVGKWFATELLLLDPGIAFRRVPELAAVHHRAHRALIRRYGTLNYPAIDYIVLQDGSIKILNVLARALTPNLEGQIGNAHRLAQATADVEVAQLAKLAWQSHRQGVRVFDA